MALRRLREDSMVQTRWTLTLLGALLVVVTFLVSDDVTVRMTAGMAYGAGLAILAVSSRIITGTRQALDTRMAAIRGGSIKD